MHKAQGVGCHPQEFLGASASGRSRGSGSWQLAPRLSISPLLPLAQAAGRRRRHSLRAAAWGSSTRCCCSAAWMPCLPALQLLIRRCGPASSGLSAALRCRRLRARHLRMSRPGSRGSSSCCAGAHQPLHEGDEQRLRGVCLDLCFPTPAVFYRPPCTLLEHPAVEAAIAASCTWTFYSYSLTHRCLLSAALYLRDCGDAAVHPRTGHEGGGPRDGTGPHALRGDNRALLHR